VEKSIGTVTVCGNKQAPVNTADRTNERARAMSDLLVLALSCDITRVSSFMFCNREDFRRFPTLNITEGGCVGSCDNFEIGHHGISHDGSTEGRQSIAKIMRDQMTQLGYLLDKLAAIKEGDGTLLDNVALFYASETASSGSHLAHNMTVLFCGKSSGKMRTGIEVKAGGGQYANALCSLANLAGVPMDRFGKYGNGKITGIHV
jgi:Protein of unknown function (DUF1552)